MKSISFKNFRRFETFPEFKFGDITILVGGNNAGKSTLVKALMLVMDNLKTMRRDIFRDGLTSAPEFRFVNNQYHNLLIGSFDQAINRNHQGENMEFVFSIDGITFTLTIGVSDGKGDVRPGNLNKIMIADEQSGLQFVVDYTVMHIRLTHQDASSGDQWVELDDKKYSHAQLQDIIDSPIRFNFSPLYGNIYDEILDYFVRGVKNAENLYGGVAERYLRDIEDCRVRIKNSLQQLNLVYLQAHGVKQQTLYRIGDNSDFTSATLSEFVAYKVHCAEEKRIHSFISQWMQWLEIGYDYKINVALDEALAVTIFENENDKTGFPMAQLGLGSIQLMVLLFGLATQMKKSGRTGCYPTVIIEEPEQNLHPARQSKLADLFSQLTRCSGFNFVIETHSEYMVRRSQVLMAAPSQAIWYPDTLLTAADSHLDASDKPFKVYYFPSDGTPYDMKYTLSGRFENKFGNGFFDESAKWHMEILRKEKEGK